MLILIYTSIVKPENKKIAVVTTILFVTIHLEQSKKSMCCSKNFHYVTHSVRQGMGTFVI